MAVKFNKQANGNRSNAERKSNIENMCFVGQKVTGTHQFINIFWSPSKTVNFYGYLLFKTI
jgi:hypothetical protein